MQHIEARLIVPTSPNPDSDLPVQTYDVRMGELERWLAKMFGGYTVTEGRGAWYEYEGSGLLQEAVRVYLLSFTNENLKASESFEELREMVKVRLDQRAVYLSHSIIEDAAVQ